MNQTASTAGSLPLKNLLVVSLEGAIAGPLASCKLADAGARVIKIERDGGDMSRGYDTAVMGASSYFLWLNRGKESAQLNYKVPADQRVLHRLLAKADVFIQNLGPNVSAQAGFSSTELRTRNPRLITCDISGYGSVGPYAPFKAYDLLVQAESGVISVTGSAEAPSRIGVSACDISAGMNAHAAIMEALYHREVTGEGSAIEVSLFGGMAEWMAIPLMNFEYKGTVWPRVGLGNPSLCPYEPFATIDGSTIIIGVSNDDEWRRLATAMKRPDVMEDPRFLTNVARVQNRSMVNEIVTAFTQRLAYGELASVLQAAGIAFGRINDVTGLAAHPQLQRISYETPVGRITTVAPAAAWAEGRRQYRPVPGLGEHTAALRREFSEDGLFTETV